MKQLLSFFIIISFSIQSLATECSGPVTYLLEGQKTSCNGYLFSPEKEQEVRLMYNAYPVLEDVSKKQDELITTLNQRIDIQTNLNNNLTQQIDNKNKMDKWTNALWFVGGIIVTTAIVYATKKKDN